MIASCCFRNLLDEHLSMFATLGNNEPDITAVATCLCSALQEGHMLLVAGNGGSAADAQHFAAELVGRFQRNRRALPCIALTTDTSNLTAIGNDFGFDKIFSRQVEGLGKPGDVFVGISTSGNSPNILQGLRIARQQGMKTIALLGRDGGILKSEADHVVVIAHDTTARIQEAHIFILHYWAECIEETALELFNINNV